MKIVVVGGTGLIGLRVVTLLTRDGHDVAAASRRSGVHAVTGEGLAKGQAASNTCSFRYELALFVSECPVNVSARCQP